MSLEISVLIALAGCFVGLAGWLAGRDKKLIGEAEWRGGVNAMLEVIHKDVGEVGGEMTALRTMVIKYGERLTAVEASDKSAHKRLDRLEGKEGA